MKRKFLLMCSTVFIVGAAMVAPVSAAVITDIDVDPDDHDFDDVNIDSTRDKSFTITNNSADPVNLNFDITGDDDDQFDINDNNCSTELIAGNDCDIEIRFSPDDEGNFDAVLEVEIDEDPDGLIEVDLEGSGVESDNDVDLSDDSLNFEDTYVGYYSVQEVEVTNKGSKIFTILDLSLNGTDESDFEIDTRGCEDMVLAEDDTCSILVFFAPETAGSKSAEMEILVEDDVEDYVVTLDGDAVAKQNGITVDPVRRDLGDFEKGEDESFTFRVENEISTAYEITDVTLTGSSDFDLIDDECENEEVDDGTAGGDVLDNCDIDIEYTASEAGLVYAELEVETTDPNNSSILVPMWAFVEGLDDYPDDIEGGTFETYIKRLMDEKIVSGYSDGEFKPGQPVTRGQLAKFIFNALRIIEDKTCNTFPDVTVTNTFYDEIMSLKCAGIVSGYSDGTYRPEDPVTRGEVTKFVTKALQEKNVSVDLNKTEDFPDVDDRNKFIIYIAYLASLRIEGQNIISGYSDGEFKSERLITRGEMSKMVDLAKRYYDNY